MSPPPLLWYDLGMPGQSSMTTVCHTCLGVRDLFVVPGAIGGRKTRVLRAVACGVSQKTMTGQSGYKHRTFEDEKYKQATKATAAFLQVKKVQVFITDSRWLNCSELSLSFSFSLSLSLSLSRSLALSLSFSLSFSLSLSLSHTQSLAHSHTHSLSLSVCVYIYIYIYMYTVYIYRSLLLARSLSLCLSFPLSLPLSMMTYSILQIKTHAR